MLIYKKVSTSEPVGHHAAVGADPELVGQDVWGSQGQDQFLYVYRSEVGAGL